LIADAIGYYLIAMPNLTRLRIRNLSSRAAGVFLLCSMSLYAGSAQVAPTRMALEAYSHDAKTYEVAHWLAIYGLAAMFLPQLVDEDVSDLTALVITSGFVAFEVGIPLMGSKAGRMAKTVQAVRPEYHPPFSGWPIYWTGKGLQVAGLTLMSLEGLVMAFSIVAGDEPDQTLLEVAGFSLLGGFLLEGGSWYLFSRVHASALEQAPVELKLSFGLHPSANKKGSGNLPIPGAVLALNF
jgi:hypothetical protein